MFPQSHNLVGLRTDIGEIGNVNCEDRSNGRQDVVTIMFGKEAAETGLRKPGQRLNGRKCQCK